MADTLNAFKVFLLDVLTLLRAGCASPMGFYAQFTLTITLFMVVGGLVVLALVARAARALKIERQRAAAGPSRATRTLRASQPPRRDRGGDRDASGRPARRRSSVGMALAAGFEATRATTLTYRQALRKLEYDAAFRALNMFL